eukprot:gene18353-829_t
MADEEPAKKKAKKALPPMKPGTKPRTAHPSAPEPQSKASAWSKEIRLEFCDGAKSYQEWVASPHGSSPSNTHIP